MLTQVPPGPRGLHLSALSRQQRALLLALANIAIIVFMIAGGAAGGEIAAFVLVGVTFVPFILLGSLLQLGEMWTWLRVVAWIWFWVIIALSAALLFSLLAQFINGPTGTPSTPEQSTRTMVSLILLTVTTAVMAVLVITRQWVTLAQWLGARKILPDSSGQAQAVVGLVFFALTAFGSLIALQGQPLLLDMIQRAGDDQATARGAQGQFLDLFYELIWTVPFAFVAVGLPVRATLTTARRRLGLLPLPLRVLPLLLGIAVAMIGLSFLSDAVLNPVWDFIGWPRTDPDLVKQLFGATTDSLSGAVAVGIVAGLSEELLVRGVLQPRLGWFLPNLAFAGAHAFQYGPDGLVTVFLIGTVQAFVRARWNTSAAAITHGSYDCLLIAGSVLGLPGF